MATQSPPPNPADEKPPSPVKELAQAAADNGQAKEEADNGMPSKSVFVNSQPIREEQVQNAVNFLSHPKVKGSPIIHRRNFLERKGLTKEEIDEAFRRVPDPSPAFTSVQATSTNQDGQLKPSANIQHPPPIQAHQSAAASPSGVMSTVTRRFHWSHAFLAIGLLAASSAGTAVVFKNAILPRLKSWIRKVVSDQEDDLDTRNTLEPSLAEETAAAAKAAAAAAADVAKASQEMLITKNEEKKCFEEFMNLLDVQVQEIKSMRNSIQKLEGQNSTGRNSQVEGEYLNGSFTRSKQSMDAKAEFDLRSVKSSSSAPSAEPPHPKSYMEIMAMVQRGEKPPNIREINDLPPNPNQPISNPSFAPRPKPWEGGLLPRGTSFAPPPPPITSESSSFTVQDNGVTHMLNGNTSAPWLQQKNVRITEIESGDDFWPPSSGGSSFDQPPLRKWVPPQPPPVALPEAAAAIRQPKPLMLPRDRVVDNVARPMEEFDELERITKVSESGSQPETITSEAGSRFEMNGGGPENSSGKVEDQVAG